MDRAVLSIALEDGDSNGEHDLVPRIVDAMRQQPQCLAEYAGIEPDDGAMARARMALFDARRTEQTPNPSLQAFIGRFR